MLRYFSLIAFLFTFFSAEAHANALPNATAPNWQTSLSAQYPALEPVIGWLPSLAGLLVLVIVIWIGFSRIVKVQREQLSRIKNEEISLQRKQKLVLAAAFSNELTENKIKCETFITIYSELLRNLRELDRKAPYEDTGDFIHQHPPLTRVVFDDNIEHLSFFGPKVAGELTQVYAAIRSEPQYFSLESTMPRAAAIRIVEMVLDDAQRTLEPLETIVGAMNVIVRDGAQRNN